MKRWFRVLILFVVALVSGVTFGAGVSNISAATTQDFSISTYVHGTKTYRITYTQRDVTRY
jgi:hypothetical protein